MSCEDFPSHTRSDVFKNEQEAIIAAGMFYHSKMSGLEQTFKTCFHHAVQYSSVGTAWFGITFYLVFSLQGV